MILFVSARDQGVGTGDFLTRKKLSEVFVDFEIKITFGVLEPQNHAKYGLGCERKKNSNNDIIVISCFGDGKLLLQ